MSAEPTSDARAPRQFHYWRNLDAPWVRMVRAGARSLLGFDPAPPDAVVRALAAMYYDADPLAEAFAPRGDEPLPQRVRAALEHRLHLAYTRLFLPPPSHRRNRLPGAGPWVLAPLIPAPAVATAELLRRWLPAVDDAMDRRARRRRARWFARPMGDRDAQYRPADAFTR